jgi:hypothetical protein
VSEREKERERKKRNIRRNIRGGFNTNQEYKHTKKKYQNQTLNTKKMKKITMT